MVKENIKFHLPEPLNLKLCSFDIRALYSVFYCSRLF